MKYFKNRPMLILLTLLLAFLAGCSGEASEKPIAEVNGEKLTQSQLKATTIFIYPRPVHELKPEDAKEVEDLAFNFLVSLTLAAQEKNRLEKVDMQALAAQELQKFQQTNQMSPEAYKDFLNQHQLEEKAFAEVLAKRNLSLALMEEKTADVVATTEEARALFDSNRDSYKQEPGIQISHILVATEAEALDLIAKIQAGANFSDLAKQFSTCGSSSKGGDLGICNAATNFVEEFKTAALALKPGEMTLKPVKTTFGYHIIKAGESFPGKNYTFDEIADTLKEQLTRDKKQKAFNEYMKKELESKATIKDLRSNAN